MTEALRQAAEGVTEEEFLALPETRERLELVDGEVIVGPSPTFFHQDLVLGLGAALRAWSRGRAARVGLAPLDIRFGPSRILQPDLALWVEGLEHYETPIQQVPELTVEVLSGNRVYDRIAKRSIYADAGVVEYWLVDPRERCVERLTGAGLEQLHRVIGRLESPLLPGFSLDIAALLER